VISLLSPAILGKKIRFVVTVLWTSKQFAADWPLTSTGLISSVESVRQSFKLVFARSPGQ
jgi:hypothetical protein